VKAEAKGFKSLEQTGITLTVMEAAHLDLPLSVGEACETVSVTSELPLVNSANATLGRTVDNKEIDNLPLVNRNVYQLLTLTAGVQSSTNVNLLGYPEQHTIINGSSDSTVGQVSYYLDGGSNMSGLRNTGNILPNDAIREFVVQTNNFSAQYGRTSAGIVTVLTKSGTNSVHGSIFEFNRNTSFNATTHASTTNLPYHRNQFGATAGGPIRHDRTFFFGSYGGLRQSTSSLLTGAIVPTSAQRTGNFSANLPTSSGAIGTNCNMALSAADKAAGNFIVCNPVTRQPYAGSVIPTAALDRTAQNIINKNIPLPNIGSTGFTGSVTVPQQNDEFLIKVEHALAENHRLTASYFQTNGNWKCERFSKQANSAGWKNPVLTADWVTQTPHHLSARKAVHRSWCAAASRACHTYGVWRGSDCPRGGAPGCSATDCRRGVWQNPAAPENRRSAAVYAT